MGIFRETVEGLKKNLGVSDAEAERIRNHLSVEEYPSDWTKIEKLVAEDKNDGTIVRLIRAYGRKRDREYRSSRRPP